MRVSRALLAVAVVATSLTGCAFRAPRQQPPPREFPDYAGASLMELDEWMEEQWLKKPHP